MSVFNSVNQDIDIRYKAAVLSEDVNDKIGLIFGSAKIEGLEVTVTDGATRACSVSPGSAVIKGVTVIENSAMAFTMDTFASGLVYVYAHYEHGDGAVCEYVVSNALISSPYYLLLATTSVYTGTIADEDIDNARAMTLLNNAVSFSDREGKVIEEVSGIYIGQALLGAGETVLSSEEPVFLDGVLTATSMYNAFLSDFAEYFEFVAPAGYVVAIDENAEGNKEAYALAERKGNNIVLGVVSTKPAHAIGGDPTRIQDFSPIAMAGKVPVQVFGKCKRGDTLALSDVPGVARSVGKNPRFIKATEKVGIALENKNKPFVGLVETLIGKL